MSDGHRTLLAGLPMYDFLELRDATDALWAAMATHLTAAGQEHVPAKLHRPDDLIAFWRDPVLLLGQTCGYPLVQGLCGDVQLVATPVYTAPGCEGARYGSVIIVPANSPIRQLAETQGTVCAINDADSNTGMNLLRHALALIGARAPFFSRVIVSGAHRNSLALVASGAADVAAIDCVTFAHSLIIDPSLSTRVRPIGRTATTPGLPLITASNTPATTLKALRDALTSISAERPDCLDTLMIRDFNIVPRAAYDAVSELAEQARQLGYPALL